MRSFPPDKRDQYGQNYSEDDQDGVVKCHGSQLSWRYKRTAGISKGCGA